MDDRKKVLKLRTKEFASSVLRLYRRLNEQRTEQRVIGHQLIRSATSVAANYREASRARSDAEFVSKIELCTQEADESQLWLELLRDDCGIAAADVDPIWAEADELIAIFVSTAKAAKKSGH